MLVMGGKNTLRLKLPRMDGILNPSIVYPGLHLGDGSCLGPGDDTHVCQWSGLSEVSGTGGALLSSHSKGKSSQVQFIPTLLRSTKTHCLFNRVRSVSSVSSVISGKMNKQSKQRKPYEQCMQCKQWRQCKQSKQFLGWCCLHS